MLTKRVAPRGPGFVDGTRGDSEPVRGRPSKQGRASELAPLPSFHRAPKGLQKVEAELISTLEGLDTSSRRSMEGDRALATVWARLDGPTQAQLREVWLQRLLRPTGTEQLQWEQRWMRTFFGEEFHLLIERSLTEIPTDPEQPLPESLRQASTPFLRTLASALDTASLTRRLALPPARGARDREADPFTAKLINLGRELVTRARWGEHVELEEIQPRIAEHLHDTSPAALQKAQLARFAAQALVGMVKTAAVGAGDNRRNGLTLELRDGTRRELSALYRKDDLRSRGNWWGQQEQQVSLALVLLANPRHAALRKVWDRLYADDPYGLQGELLGPAVQAIHPPPSEAGRRYERALDELVEALTTGAARPAVEMVLTRLGASEGLPDGRRARAILRLFGAVEANPRSPGATAAIARMIELARGFPSSRQFHPGSLATRALAVVGQAQMIDGDTLARIAFDLLNLTNSAHGLANRADSLLGSGLIDKPSLDVLLARVHEAEKRRIDEALGARHPDVARFVGDLQKQRVQIAQGLEPAIPDGLRGAIDAAYQLRAGQGSAAIPERIARVLPLLEEAWRGAPSPAPTLYGAALVDALKASYPDEVLRAWIPRVQDLVERAGSAGQHAGVQRHLAAFFALAEVSLGLQTFRGPAYSVEGLEAALARLQIQPADPWAALAHLQGMLALLPEGRASDLTAATERIVGLLLTGHEREAKAQISGLWPKFESAFVRPPVLEERIRLADKLDDADLLLGLLGVRGLGPAVRAFAETPTAANLNEARQEWETHRTYALNRSQGRKERERAAIEIAVNMVDAVLAPEIDARWCASLEVMMGKAFDANHAPAAEPPRAAPERALEWALGELDVAGHQGLKVLSGHDERAAIQQEILRGASAGGPQTLATLELASRLLVRWAQLSRERNPQWAQSAERLMQDQASARAAGHPELALHQLTGALTDYSVGRGTTNSSERASVLGWAFASRLRALEEARPADEQATFTAALVGSMRVLSALLPAPHPLGSVIDGHLDAAWAALLQGKLSDAQAELRLACRVGGSLSFDSAPRARLEAQAKKAQVTRVSVSRLQVGDLVRFAPDTPEVAGKVACFGGRQGERLFFTGPGGATWSIPTGAQLKVERFPSTTSLWETVVSAPGAIGGWAFVRRGHHHSSEEQWFGRLERDPTGALQLVTATGRIERLDLSQVTELEVGLSRRDYLDRFFAVHQGAGMIATHAGGSSQGVLLSAEGSRLELRNLEGQLEVIAKDQIDGVQSAYA